MIKMVGYDMAKAAAEEGLRRRPASAPRTCDVVELHDCFTANELLTYEALGLCPEGGAEKFIGTATTPTAASSSPTRRAACCPRATRSARRASRSAPSWCGSCAARPSERQVRGREGRAAAQPRPRRRVRRDHVPDGLSERTMNEMATGVIDAWIQHPTPKFMPRTRCSRRCGAGRARRRPTEIPLELHGRTRCEAAGVDRALLTAWSGPTAALISNDEVAGERARAPRSLRRASPRSISGTRWTRCASCGARVKELGLRALRMLPVALEPAAQRPALLPAVCRVRRARDPLLPAGRPHRPAAPVRARPPDPLPRRGRARLPRAHDRGRPHRLPVDRRDDRARDEVPERLHRHVGVQAARAIPPSLASYLRGHGRKKVLFGSNYPMILPGECLEQVDSLGLDDEPGGSSSTTTRRASSGSASSRSRHGPRHALHAAPRERRGWRVTHARQV